MLLESSEEPSQGMLLSAQAQRGKEGTRENQLAREGGQEISGFLVEEALKSQHVCS